MFIGQDYRDEPTGGGGEGLEYKKMRYRDIHPLSSLQGPANIAWTWARAST